MNDLLTSLKKDCLRMLVILGILKAQEAMTPFQKFCDFIKGYEVANPVNNNPFNDRYYWGGYLPKYGIVKESPGGFAMFETLALGEMYGETIVREIVNKHSQWNFYNFFALYAPTKDHNNPVAYAEAGALYMSVEPTANLKNTLNI